MMQHALRFKLQLALGALLLVLAVLTTTRDARTAGEEPIQIEYEGRLQDEAGKPIAGIFPLEFRLYRTEDSQAPIWRESHWVSVLKGRYELVLGRDRRIRTQLVKPGDQVFLGVNLQDGGELTREALTIPEDDAKPVAPAQDTPELVAQAPGQDSKPGAPGKDGKYKIESSFAEVADFARRAENAENAQKLGGKTLAELEEELDNIKLRIAELRKAEGGGAVTVGNDTQLLQRVGGNGGGPYVRECPPGQVVVGLRGTSGAVVDSFQVICAPLQSR
jgi:hypothetical protein